MDEDDADDSGDQDMNEMYSEQLPQLQRSQGPHNKSPSGNNDANHQNHGDTQIPNIVISRSTETTEQRKKTPEWQIVKAKKRPRRDSNHSSNVGSLPDLNRNRFSVFQPDDSIANKDDSNVNTEENETSNDYKEPKPPPIFIPGIQDIEALTSIINTVINASEYTQNYR